MNYLYDKRLSNIDSKGRLLIPKDIRDKYKIVKSKTLYLIVNRRPVPYLAIRTEEMWKELREGFLNTGSDQDRLMAFRYLEGEHAKILPDGQGRILIPDKLRADGSLDGSVVVLDMTLHIEVWREAHLKVKWPEFMNAYEEFVPRLFSRGSKRAARSDE